MRESYKRPQFFDRLPRFLFVAAVILAAFALGWKVGTFKIFPHAILSDGYKSAKMQIALLTARELVPGFVRFVDVVPDRVEMHRWEFVAADALVDPVLVTGGYGKFAEYCPGHVGCLAVEYEGDKNVLHAYPYRSEEIEKIDPIVAFPYERPLGFSMTRHTVLPWSSLLYGNGDLLVTLQSSFTFPYGLGFARINRDGRLIWYRQDYSHNEPRITKGGGGGTSL